MDTATTDIYTYSQTLSLRVVLPIYRQLRRVDGGVARAAGAAHVGCAELVIFARLEMRLQVRPAPAVAIPLVIVARLAADIDNAIQRIRSAERLAAHTLFAPIMAAGLLPDIAIGQHRTRQRPAQTAGHDGQLTGTVRTQRNARGEKRVA